MNLKTLLEPVKNRLVGVDTEGSVGRVEHQRVRGESSKHAISELWGGTHRNSV